MKRSDRRILTTHVGSLIRSKAALDASRNHDQNKLTEEVTEIVAQQAKAGIDIVNDGEFGKSGWANYVLERMTGLSRGRTSSTTRYGSAATASVLRNS